MKKRHSRTPLTVTINATMLNGAPKMKVLLFLALKGPATAENLIESGVLELSPGNVRSVLSGCVVDRTVIKGPADTTKKQLGAKPHLYRVSASGLTYLKNLGVQNPTSK
jgi:hypothetical protein